MIALSRALAPLRTTAAQNGWGVLALGLILTCAWLPTLKASTFEARGNQFIGLNRFAGFEKSKGSKPSEVVLTSPVIVSRINWEELVASWNADVPDGTYLKLEARAL